MLKAFLEAQWRPSVAGQSPVTCPGYLSSPATPTPCWTLDSGPCPRWPPHQLARRIRASAQISNVTLSDSRLCLSQHPILLPHYQLSSLTSPLSIQPPTARIYSLSATSKALGSMTAGTVYSVLGPKHLSVQYTVVLPLYRFARVSVTKHHPRGGLQQQKWRPGV